MDPETEGSPRSADGASPADTSVVPLDAEHAPTDHDPQQDLWAALLRARYMVVIAIGLAALGPWAGPNHWSIAIAMFAFGLPYNAFFDVWFRRRGSLPPLMAVTDQLVAVAIFALAPELMGAILLVMLSTTANTALAFGRRLAWISSAIGAAGVVIVAMITTPIYATPMLITYVVLAGLLGQTIGSIVEIERDLRVRYRELLGGLDVIAWEQLTAHPSTLFVNATAVNLLGYPAEDWAEPGMWARVVHPDDAYEMRKAYRDAIRKGTNREFEYRMIAADGRTVHILDRLRVSVDDLGRPTRVRGVMIDVSETKLAQEKASQFVNLVDDIKLALFVFGLEDPDDDESLALLAINPEAAKMINVDPERAPGKRFGEIVHLPADDLLAGSLADVVRTGQGFTLDEFRPDPDGRGGRVYSAHAFPLPGNAVGLSLHDITERTIAAEVLRRQALHDGLTGLPNRTLLHERTRAAIRAAEHTGQNVALLTMDLDQFKEVNDALGHDSGDRLLIEMSRRLQRVLRDVETIARLGGDEFAVLVTSSADAAGATETAIAIRHALEQPFQLGGITIQARASIGIAVYPDHAHDAETLAQRADVAMYEAKRNGGGGSALYSPDRDQSSVRRLALLGELRGAIASDDLVLYYQPALDLATGEVTSAEALVRWQHPVHGLMPPGDFIELAEVSGLIQPMTRWIIEQAFEQIRIWGEHGLAIKVGINLSVRNLRDRDLVPWITEKLLTSGVDASLVKFEVTESELMDDPMQALEVLGRLRTLGAMTSIDDFGTGYSSLSYLKHLPIDELKIDMSFISTMMTDISDLTIVRSTIELGHALGLSVVAEGVEDGPTLHHLATLNCDRAQGYLISRPVPADRLLQWLTGGDELEIVRGHLLADSAI